MSAPDDSSLERLVPDRVRSGEASGEETLELHLERYRFAARHAGPGRLLDAACGVGYGTRLLADALGVPVQGVDLSEEAIAYAEERYGGEGVVFRRADLMALDDGEGFDTIVSLETIEHLEDPAGFLAKMVRLLRPGGRFVGSVPTTPSTDVNPYHLHDFSRRSFRRMIAEQGLREIACLEQRQRVNPLEALWRSEARMQEARPDLLRYYALHPGAVLRRLTATLRYGFSIRYLTLACEKAPAD